MAARYWVYPLSGEWNAIAGTKWALTSGGAGGASAPTSADDVFFDAASGSVPVSIDTGNTGAKSITCTGFTGTLSGFGPLSVAGNITFVAGQTITYFGTITLTASSTLITAGKTLVCNVEVNAAGGTVILGGALTCKNFTVTAGTFTTTGGNYALTIQSFASVGAITRAVFFRGSTVTLTSINFNCSETTGLTFDAGTSTIVASSTAGVNLTLPFTGLTFYNFSITGTTAGTTFNIRGGNTFNNLTITSPSGDGIIKAILHDTQTITTLVANGASAVRRIMFQSVQPDAATTLTVGTYTTKQNVDFRDITAAGASSPWSGTRLGNCLGNTNITFSAAKTVYWNLTGSQNWTSIGWATTSGGSPSVNNFPLAQDTAVLDDAGAATTISVNTGINIGTFNASARTTAVTISSMSSVEIYGNFTNGTGVTITSATAILSFFGTSTQTITSAGQSFGRIASTRSSCTVSLADALSTSGTQSISFQSGASFNANTFNVTGNSFSMNLGSVNIGTAVWTLFGTGTVWSVSAGVYVTLTGSAEIILSNTTTTARTFAGGDKTYGKLTIGGATGTSTLTLTGANTFSEITSTKTVAHTIVFPNVTTTVGAFTVNGSPGNLATLSRTGASGTFTLDKSGGGTVTAEYLSISNSTATPDSTWTAINSTDGGGNTGWSFVLAGGGGSFIAFFM